MSGKDRNFRTEYLNGISYTRCGAGKPVILLHGLAASYHDWDALVPQLVSEGYETICPDLPGHGLSFKSKQLDDYHVEKFYNILYDWIVKLELQMPLTLVGHSLGGHLALEFAIRCPGWIDRLVLVDPLYLPNQIPLIFRLAYRERMLSYFITRSVPDWFYDGMIELSSILIPGRHFLKHDLPHHVRKQMVENYKLASAGIYRLPLSGRNLETFVGQIKIPTLLVYGIRDQTLAPRSFPKLASLIPDVLLKPIGAGHTPHQSNSEEFNQAVLDFLSRNQ